MHKQNSLFSINRILIFAVFLLLLSFIIIVNVQLSESLIVKINNLRKEIIELKCEYILYNSNYMNLIKQSVISEKAFNNLNMKYGDKLPFKVLIKKNDINYINMIKKSY